MGPGVDVTIIGGGITGLGVALEATRWGFHTVLCEREKIGAGTSANSLRIIHGGFRYLQHFNVKRVIESAREQRYWLKETPQFIKPLPCLAPLTKSGLGSAVPIRAAAALYGTILKALGSPLDSPRVLSRKESEQRCPALVGQVPHGALYWQDAILEDPAGFVRFLSEKIVEAGGELREDTAVHGLSRINGHWQVNFPAGALDSQVVVDACGVSRREVLQISDPAGGALDMDSKLACVAINLEFDFQIDATVAIGRRSPSGRLFFAVPRGKHMAIGTWYYPKSQTLSDKTEEDCFLAELRLAFCNNNLVRERVCSVDRGALPMKRVGDHGPVLYGRHQINESNGLVQVMSTKYTTFRLVGIEAMRAARAALRVALS